MTAIDTAAIQEAITEYFGPRCSTKDTDDFPDLPDQGRCHACKAWEQFDALCDALDPARFDNRITNALLDGAMRRVTTLRAENERLRAALRPFAAFADLIDLETTGFSECDEFDLIAEGGWHAERFTLQEFRSARAALSQKETNQ